MSQLREHLASQIARKVQAHGLVIWEDDAGEYRDVARSVIPEGVDFEPFDGSWYELRRRLEDYISGDKPPSLVVYVPSSPSEDPLEEVRALGVAYTRKLSTLVKQAMAGELTETRITEIGRQARALVEAEAAIASSSEGDVRLIPLLGSTDASSMLAALLSAAYDESIDSANMWPAVAELSRLAVGADVTGSNDELRDALFRHLILCEISQVLPSELPSPLRSIRGSPSAAQRKRAADVLSRLRGSAGGLATYMALAARADDALALRESLLWAEPLGDLPGSPAVDWIGFTEALLRLESRDYRGAMAIASRRLQSSPWSNDASSDWAARWRAVDAVANLREEIAGARPVATHPRELLSWYVEAGWRVDRAHRRLELARTELRAFGELEAALTEARGAYDVWLDGLLTRFTRSLESGALDNGSLLRQGEIHDRFVGDLHKRTAYVWVDALRYEMGVDLAEALRAIDERVELHAAVAAAPTITLVGMANLLPAAASSLQVSLVDGGNVRVSVAGVDVAGVPQRRELLRTRHGPIADLELNDAAQRGERALQKAIAGAKLVLVRSQEVDAAGESGMLSVAWSHFANVTNLIASVVARLGQAGIERVVITADHGFIALGQDLGSERLVDAPSGAVGTIKRRAFIGRGGTPNPATVRVPLASCGVASDLDLIVPRGLAVFRAGGGRQFFHGGLSPQELLVPVVVMELATAPEPQKLSIDVQVAGGRITTGVFAATLVFQGNLFTNEVSVRIVASGSVSEGPPVARLVSGDGYDAPTGVVHIRTGQPSVLTFQITGNLEAGTSVELHVLDARTGRTMATTTIPVAAPVVVEDELD